MQETALYGTLILVFTIVCILFESIVIYIFKITQFVKALGQSTLVNLVTLGMIYLLWPLLSRLDIGADKVFPFVPILFGATFLVEGILLKLLNRHQTTKRIAITALVMNLVSFGSLFMILSIL